MYCWLPEYVNYGLSSSSFRYEYGIVFELLALKRFEAGAKYDQDATKRGKRRRMKTAGCKIWEGERNERWNGKRFSIVPSFEPQSETKQSLRYAKSVGEEVCNRQQVYSVISKGLPKARPYLYKWYIKKIGKKKTRDVETPEYFQNPEKK